MLLVAAIAPTFTFVKELVDLDALVSFKQCAHGLRLDAPLQLGRDSPSQSHGIGQTATKRGAI